MQYILYPALEGEGHYVVLARFKFHQEKLSMDCLCGQDFFNKFVETNREAQNCDLSLSLSHTHNRRWMKTPYVTALSYMESRGQRSLEGLVHGVTESQIRQRDSHRCTHTWCIILRNKNFSNWNGSTFSDLFKYALQG